MSLYAAEALERQTTVSGVLKTTCVELTNALRADACNLSRVIGQLLVDLVAYSKDGRRIMLGRSYLVPDYPVTQEAIDTMESRSVWLLDPNVDPSEAALLRELDFDALLMLPFPLDGRAWGLVEIYRTDAFGKRDVELATAIIEHASAMIERVQRRAAEAA